MTLSGVTSEKIPSSFIESFSGEWIGFESEFDAATGRIVPVASHLLPEEYQEWEVEVKGLEHLTSTTVKDDVLYCKSMRLLPSCGCAVDSVPTEKKVEQQEISCSSLFPDGSAFLLEPAGQDFKWKLFLSSPSSPLLRLQVCGSSVARAGTLRLRLEEKLAAFDDAASYWEVFRDPKALKRMTELGEMAGASKAGGRWRVKRVIFPISEGGSSVMSQSDEIVREDEKLPVAPHGLSLHFHGDALRISFEPVEGMRKTFRASVRDGRLEEVELREEERV